MCRCLLCVASQLLMAKLFPLLLLLVASDDAADAEYTFDAVEHFLSEIAFYFATRQTLVGRNRQAGLCVVDVVDSVDKCHDSRLQFGCFLWFVDSHFVAIPLSAFPLLGLFDGDVEDELGGDIWEDELNKKLTETVAKGMDELETDKKPEKTRNIFRRVVSEEEEPSEKVEEVKEEKEEPAVQKKKNEKKASKKEVSSMSEKKSKEFEVEDLNDL